MEFIIESALKQSKETQFEEGMVGQANIKVIGVGGAGGNAASWLYKKGIKGAEVICMNTDKQHLDIHEADRKILIGRDLTKGLGAGGYPRVGMESAKEASSEIKDALKELLTVKYLIAVELTFPSELLQEYIILCPLLVIVVFV